MNGPELVVAHARSMIGVPWRHQGRKPWAVDCLGLVELSLLHARWPGAVAAGGVATRVTTFWDWMPTFADLAGVPAPARTDGVRLPTMSSPGVMRMGSSRSAAASASARLTITGSWACSR